MEKLTRVVWGVDDPLADELIDGPSRLVLRLWEAENMRGPTVAGTIGFGVGPETEALYGPAIMEAVFLAAVNLDTGGCAYGEVAPALAMSALHARPQSPPVVDSEDDDGEATNAEVGGVDLLPLIGLPRDGARYAVFAWLDDLLSEVTIIRMPDAGERSGPPVSETLLEPCAIPGAKRRNVPYLDDSKEFLILPEGAERGASALFAIDGASRRVTASSWLVMSASTNCVSLGGYLRQLEPSPYPSRLVCYFASCGLHELMLPASSRIDATSVR